MKPPDGRLALALAGSAWRLVREIAGVPTPNDGSRHLAQSQGRLDERSGRV